MRVMFKLKQSRNDMRRSMCVLANLFLFLFTVGVWSANAQQITANGVVKDASGLEIIGANVSEKGTTNGTITDLDGKFTLNVQAGKTLVISYIGYTTKEIPASANMTVTLNDDNQVLDEVVVVGYGSTVKKDLTTAVTSVKSTDFLQGASNSPLQLINGKVAGLNVSGQAAADPNTDPNRVQVRGASSLKAGNSPLIVIDGIPGGDMRTLSQQDIESITVLKDGSAAAIYGSKAANGVILIQTKQGKSGKVSISYDGYVEHDWVADKPDILSAEEFLDHNIDVDRGSRTNWYDELINKNNFGQNHNLAMSGGSESTIFRLSANYRTKEGLDLSTNRKEAGVRGNFKQIALENRLEVTGNIAYRVVDEDYTELGSFKQAVELNPTWNIDEMDAFRNSFDTYNPVKNLTERDRGARKEYSNIDFTAKLNIWKELNTEVKLARQSMNNQEREYDTSNYRESIRNNYDGRAKLKSEQKVDYTFEWLGNYAFNIDRHSFKVMGGYSYQEQVKEWFFAENMNFASDAYEWNYIQGGDYNKQSGRLGMESEKKKNKTIAFLARVNYDFDNLVLFTGSVRHEGSTKFGADHKWGTFPAASAALRVSRLSFLQDVEALDDLKVRFSYGQTGRSGFDEYESLAKYGTERWVMDYTGQWVQGYGPKNNPNYDLAWEKQISYNLGIDYTLFNSRLSGSMDFFVREGKDIISNYPVSMPPYLHKEILANVGTTQDKGFEFQANWDAVQTKDFNYTTSLTFSYTDTKLKSFSNSQFALGYIDGDGLPSPGNPGPAQRLEDGTKIGSYYMFRYAGVDEDGNILVYKDGIEGNETIRGDKASNDDRTYIGNGAPKWQLSWGNTFAYKQFDLSFFMTGKFKYDILNMHQMYYGLQGVAGINKLQSAFKENAHIKGSKVACDYFLENGNYLKMDNITLGWTPKLDTKWIANLRLYATMRNVFTITNYSVMDPSNVENQSGLWPGRSGLDLYPSARNFSFGVQITY